MFHNVDVGDNDDIVGWHGIMWLWSVEGVDRYGTKKQLAAGTTVSFFFRELRGIAMHVHYHVGSAVADFGVGMSR